MTEKWRLFNNSELRAHLSTICLLMTGRNVKHIRVLMITGFLTDLLITLIYILNPFWSNTIPFRNIFYDTVHTAYIHR